MKMTYEQPSWRLVLPLQTQQLAIKNHDAQTSYFILRLLYKRQHSHRFTWAFSGALCLHNMPGSSRLASVCHLL